MASTPPVLAEQRDVRQGANGFYTLRLLQMAGKALTIEVALSIFFDFVPNEADATVTWSQAQRDAFAAEWRRQVGRAWDAANRATHKGHPLSIAFACDLRGAAAGTQWQARVYRMKAASDFRTSSVWRGGFAGGYDAEFDSNDGLTKPVGDRTQTAMIHEFGHMIGNADEYVSGSPHTGDTASIMHSGSAVRDRHLAHFIDWAKPHIDALTPEEPVSDPKPAIPSFVTSLDLVKSAAAELAAVETWREGLGPGEGTAFAVRRRGTLEPVPIDQVAPEDFATLELVFAPPHGDKAAPAVWQPRSAEALQAIFVE